LFKATANIALLVALFAMFIDVIGLIYKKCEYPLAQALTVSVLTFFMR
jgi:hypothetical protein